MTNRWSVCHRKGTRDETPKPDKTKQASALLSIESCGLQMGKYFSLSLSLSFCPCSPAPQGVLKLLSPKLFYTGYIAFPLEPAIILWMSRVMKLET